MRNPFKRSPNVDPKTVLRERIAGIKAKAVIEEAAQAALDTADSLLAILDRMDGDTDAEDGADAEPALAAPENHHGSQVVWLRGNDGDREAEAPELVVPDVSAALAALPWDGRGNVIAVAGAVLLDMVAGR
ncbi:hypothetical protein MKK68_13075 [Methylobacterium sp. E-016]|uniref:hypothetical protein n=1 Tax=Methylobacterium sp. E-016 TaxID=2836556 RepID=UPI001FBB9920|nr:hypothetical protein [Methylobacterium sp. E-016]MCJ2076577.1 hypothetical protein [Methylobacterium sp. E-016]